MRRHAAAFQTLILKQWGHLEPIPAWHPARESGAGAPHFKAKRALILPVRSKNYAALGVQPA